MESKYTEDMLKHYPANLKFVENKKDPLHQMIDRGGVFLSELDRVESGKVEGLFIDQGNPVLPSGIYYVGPITNIEDVHITQNGDGLVVETAAQFMEDNVTGFDLVEEIQPSGVYSNGILGVSYGFDWDQPEYYLTPSGSPNVRVYNNLQEEFISRNYSTRFQNYDTIGVDEYLNLGYEVAGDGNLPAGVSSTDVVKVAYLDKVPVSSVTIVDVGNLENPDRLNSNGITVDPTQYAVTENRIVFAASRNDYVPSTLIDYGSGSYDYIYPSGYQPDSDFSSIFIAEYEYQVEDDPRYLTQSDAFHNLGKKGSPEASF